jgi:hypothetical protein
MLDAKVPGGAEILEEEHRVVAHLLDNLIAYAARWKESSSVKHSKSSVLNAILP